MRPERAHRAVILADRQRLHLLPDAGHPEAAQLPQRMFGTKIAAEISRVCGAPAGSEPLGGIAMNWKLMIPAASGPSPSGRSVAVW